MSDHRDERMGPGTYLTPEEAKEFHKLFISSFIGFTVIAIIAHFLVWSWRPWIPGPNGYAMISDGVAVAQATITAFLA
ncbi:MULTISPECIES: light-harvesting antenna LH1, beta subunit [unclassified Sphingomonas]|uniref:light-harvesting antenna LH1, beta subunit n=1 Tax=unclassified Sphingomonas TaxID=196159 RepID=UPI00082C257B|nr:MULTISPECIES: light-harvesting antenna LH1, beta subunit [unclassified Sphingomonas]MCH4891957.1 light-harvesting protein [Sphingomonas sp. SFZ2018-12]